MSGYLPDGCTQEDCDRAYGYDEPDPCSGCGGEPGNCECCPICGASPDVPCGVDCPNWEPPRTRQSAKAAKDFAERCLIEDEGCPF